MRLIPVIDLLDGLAAHAVKGERSRYRPVKSVLCDTSDPLAIARAFRDRLGLHEIYVADLNAIQGFSPTRHRDIIAALARGEKISILLDAGIPDVETAHGTSAPAARSNAPSSFPLAAFGRAGEETQGK
jgi:phosphoribosylformimino-5-aminoimidazole carboxamide ribotide isomerase